MLSPYADSHVPIQQRLDCPIEAAALLFFDIETTGLRRDRGARVREIALADREALVLHWRHGSGKPADSVLRDAFAALFGHLTSGVVVGHNVPFDLCFVLQEADRLRCAGEVRLIPDSFGPSDGKAERNDDGNGLDLITLDRLVSVRTI